MLDRLHQHLKPSSGEPGIAFDSFFSESRSGREMTHVDEAGRHADVYGKSSVLFENNVYAQIGLVMLIGLAAKNAILIVEFSKAEYERGTPIVEAALAGARLRLRPILMTAFAFILGCVPLWAASGSGAASRQILGTTVIGGMLASTFIAIFLIPVMFYLVEKASHRNGKGKQTIAPVEDAGASQPLGATER